MLDDKRFARRFAADKRDLAGWGVARIERELLRRGVVPAVAAGTAAGCHESELEAAVGVLERRYREPLAGDRARIRALGLLARKGYDLDVAYDAIRAHERRAT